MAILDHHDRLSRSGNLQKLLEMVALQREVLVVAHRDSPPIAPVHCCFVYVPEVGEGGGETSPSGTGRSPTTYFRPSGAVRQLFVCGPLLTTHWNRVFRRSESRHRDPAGVDASHHQP